MALSEPVSAEESVNAAAPTSLGGVIVVGHRMAKSASQRSPWMAELSAKGEPRWQAEIGGGGDYDRASGVVEVPSGGYLVVGELDAKAWVARVESDGGVLWQRTYASDASERTSFLDILVREDGYFLAGRRDEPGDRGLAWVVKIDESGDVAWDVSLRGQSDVQGFHRMSLSKKGENIGLAIMPRLPEPEPNNPRARGIGEAVQYLAELTEDGHLVNSNCIVIEEDEVIGGAAEKVARTIITSAFAQDNAWVIAGSRFGGMTSQCPDVGYAATCQRDVLVAKFEDDLSLAWSRQ